jgi:ribosomal protein S18 acetylase RimI-like enzyme
MRRYRGPRVSRATLPSRSLVVRPATRDRALLHVRLRDDTVLPEVDELRGWLDAIAADDSGPTTIRSAALFPRAAARFEAAGFEVADRLVLLRADLLGSGVRTAVDGRGDRATRTMHRHHLGAAAAIDRAAFGPEWGHDAKELVEICRATPVHAARHRVAAPRRLGASGREMIAYAIAGVSAEHGYLQRLAVDPGVQRRGHGRALTADALRWMMRRRLPDCLVNTSVDNVAALALYDSTGFTPMDEQLTVLHVDVRSLR